MTAYISVGKTPENIRITLLHKLAQHPLRELEGNDVSLLFLATFTQQEPAGGTEVSLCFQQQYEQRSCQRDAAKTPLSIRGLQCALTIWISTSAPRKQNA